MKYIKSLNELLDNPKEIDWIEYTKDKVQGRFDVGNVTYGILSKKVLSGNLWGKGLNNAWNYKFYLDDDGKKFYLATGYGDSLKILSTIISGFKQVYDVIKPDCLIWRVPISEKSRIQLYDKLTDNVCKTYNFYLDKSEVKVKGYQQTMVQWFLYRNESDLLIMKELNKKKK